MHIIVMKKNMWLIRAAMFSLMINKQLGAIYWEK